MVCLLSLFFVTVVVKPWIARSIAWLKTVCSRFFSDDGDLVCWCSSFVRHSVEWYCWIYLSIPWRFLAETQVVLGGC